MTTICICSQKGGVGKTTVALNLSHSFARREWNTLLADLDPQGSVAFSLAEKARQANGFAQVSSGEANLQEVLLSTIVPKLKILTHGPEAALAASNGRSREESLTKLLDQADANAFDIVVLDCPSGFGAVTVAALGRADFVLAPQQAEPLAVRSVSRLMEALKEVNERSGRGLSGAILITMLDTAQTDSMQVTHELWNGLPPDLVLDSVVTRDQIFLEASAKGIPVAMLQNNPPAAAIVFDSIAAEIEARLGLSAKTNEQQLQSFLA
jgi:chromosome partitioning protein